MLKELLIRLVPLRIIEYQQQGGPDADDQARACAAAADIAAHADGLLTGQRDGHSSRVLDRIVDAVAVLSYLPGGYTILGLHYETT